MPLRLVAIVSLGYGGWGRTVISASALFWLAVAVTLALALRRSSAGPPDDTGDNDD